MPAQELEKLLVKPLDFDDSDPLVGAAPKRYHGLRSGSNPPVSIGSRGGKRGHHARDSGALYKGSGRTENKAVSAEHCKAT